jgi:hypothetical protein
MTNQIEEPATRIIEPCEHMINAVNGLADGSLKGPMKVYTRLHTLHCAKCRTALTSLTVLHSRLGELSAGDPANIETLSPQRRSDVAEALDEIERSKS